MKKNYSQEDYINKCNALGVEFIGIGKHEHNGTIIRYVCPKHRDKGIQETDWSHFKNQKSSCRYCSGRGLTLEEAQKKVKNPNIIFISPFLGTEKPIKCYCLACGNTWINNRPVDLFKREGGCPTCSLVNKGLKRRKTHEEYERQLAEINPNIKLIGRYTRSHDYIRCKCTIHGVEWESFACNLLNQSAGCPVCNSSKGETELIEVLKDFGVNYSTQKTFKECRDIHPLRFDAYDNDNNIAFEFQGEQHYFPVDFDYNDPVIAEKSFESLKRRDAIKVDYCKKNNIQLVCIPYWERGNIRNYILEQIPEYKEEKTA